MTYPFSASSLTGETRCTFISADAEMEAREIADATDAEGTAAAREELALWLNEWKTFRGSVMPSFPVYRPHHVDRDAVIWDRLDWMSGNSFASPTFRRAVT